MSASLGNTGSGILSIVLWIAQLSRAFLIQCENCRCVPDYCSQNVPHSMCPCGVPNYQPVTCVSQASTSAQDLITQWTMSQLQQKGLSYEAVNVQPAIIPASLSSLEQEALTSSSSLSSLQYLFPSQTQFQYSYPQQPLFGTLGSQQSAVNYDQYLQNYGTARLVLRVPITILVSCPMRKNVCPFGSPSIQAVENCNPLQSTPGVRCITAEEIRRIFICAK